MDDKPSPSGEQLEKFFEKDVVCWEIAIQVSYILCIT
jgi:hypothetical protein